MVSRRHRDRLVGRRQSATQLFASGFTCGYSVRGSTATWLTAARRIAPTLWHLVPDISPTR